MLTCFLLPCSPGTLQKLKPSLECSMRDFCAVLRQEPHNTDALFYRGTLWKEMQRPDDGIRGGPLTLYSMIVYPSPENLVGGNTNISATGHASSECLHHVQAHGVILHDTLCITLFHLSFSLFCHKQVNVRSVSTLFHHLWVDLEYVPCRIYQNH